MTGTQMTVADRVSRLGQIATSSQVKDLVYGNAKADTMEQLALADLIGEVRALLTPDVMARFANLQGTSLGFKTDRQYSAEELQVPVLEATLKGFRCVGNEMNVIGGNFYAAKDGLERLINQYPGLYDLDVTPGIPKKNAKTPDVATVDVVATYTLNGEQFEHRWEGERAIVVRMNKGMLGTAAAGKAVRQAYLRIWKKLGFKADGMGEEEDGS